METNFKIFNDGISLNAESNRVLVYLKPEADENIISCAWQSVTPQIGGSVTLPTINNTISAMIEADRYVTAEQVIPLQSISKIIGETPADIRLSEPVKDNKLSNELCYIENNSSVKSLKAIWCLNHNPVCKSKENLLNTDKSTFKLENNLYLTVGSKVKGENFEVQTWTALKTIPIPNSLKSADIHVTLDPISNTPIFTITNQKY